jgi:hypothetical protein
VRHFAIQNFLQVRDVFFVFKAERKFGFAGEMSKLTTKTEIEYNK